MLPLIGMGVSLLGQGAANNATNAATVDAARYGLETTNRSIALQNWLNSINDARNKPFTDLGTTALPELEQRRLGTFDTMSSPYASRRLDMLQGGMDRQMALRGGGNNAYGQRNALQDLRASEEGLGYERALDRVRIGQGNAANAGQQYGQYANALSSAYQNAGNINSALTNSLASQRSQLYGDALNTAAGAPASMYLYNQRRQGQNVARDQDYYSNPSNAPQRARLPWE